MGHRTKMTFPKAANVGSQASNQITSFSAYISYSLGPASFLVSKIKPFFNPQVNVCTFALYTLRGIKPICLIIAPSYILV